MERARDSEIDWDALVRAAAQAREHAHAPYSRYAVGAALLSGDGAIYRGANVENGLPALGICAERTAVAVAIASGARSFRALAVVTDSSPPASPCGLCRQTLVEFTDDLPILLANPHGERHEVRLTDLLPRPFVFHRLA